MDYGLWLAGWSINCRRKHVKLRYLWVALIANRAYHLRTALPQRKLIPENSNNLWVLHTRGYLANGRSPPIYHANSRLPSICREPWNHYNRLNPRTHCKIHDPSIPLRIHNLANAYKKHTLCLDALYTIQPPGDAWSLSTDSATSSSDNLTTRGRTSIIRWPRICKKELITCRAIVRSPIITHHRLSFAGWQADRFFIQIVGDLTIARQTFLAHSFSFMLRTGHLGIA